VDFAYDPVTAMDEATATGETAVLCLLDAMSGTATVTRPAPPPP
jgi:hypothetical protein